MGAPPELDGRAAALLKSAASVKPRPVSRAGWEAVLLDAAQPRAPWHLVPAFAASVLAGVILVLAVRPSLSNQESARLAIEADHARWRHVTPERVSLSHGQLRLSRKSPSPAWLETPHLTVEVNAARFLADAVDGATTISVEEGEVMIRPRGGAPRRLHAHESLTWPRLPDIPTALLAHNAEQVCDAAPRERRDCLDRETQGHGLTAQAALYELGALYSAAGDVHQALLTWSRSLQRFPNGVLHPEVRLAMLVALTKARRFDEARDIAEGFALTCPDDPRLSDVQALRASLP